MITVTLTASTVLLVVLTVLATVGLLALAAKWLDFGGLFGGFMFLSCAQSILEGAGRVLGAILGAAAGND